MKFIKISIELIILFVLTIIFVALFCLKRLPLEHPINQTVRDMVVPHQAIVTLFRLNQIGDARYLITNLQSTPLQVEIAHPSSYVLPPELGSWLDLSIVKLLNKPVKLYVSDMNIPAIPASDEYLSELTSQDFRATFDLRLVFIPSSAEMPSSSGRTLSSKTIFIFYELIDSLSTNHSVRARIYQSTISHELGHLLGIEHSQYPNCIMSDTVEVYESKINQTRNIPLEHCLDNLTQINQLLTR